jgi:hypothetical protein
MQSRIGPLEIERVVELALLAEDASGQLVGEASVALGEPLQVSVPSISEGRAGAYVAENLQSRPASGGCFLNSATPFSVRDES